MLSDLEKAYNYLQSNNLVDTFVFHYDNASSSFKSMQIAQHRSFIRHAFQWDFTPEGQSYWNTHDDNILRLNICLSATDVYNYIESQQQIPKSYEY